MLSLSIFAITAILAGAVIVGTFVWWTICGLRLQINCDGEPEEPR